MNFVPFQLQILIHTFRLATISLSWVMEHASRPYWRLAR
jgi:hypothetical protein